MNEGVESVVAFPGLSINGFVNNPSSAVLFAMLRDGTLYQDPTDPQTSSPVALAA